MMNGSACVGVLVLRSWSWPLRPLHERPPPPTPLSYSTTFTDPSGTQQSVSFTGTASGTSLTGTLTVNGAPEQNGRHERMHRTLKQETIRPPAPTLRAQQLRFNAFQREYNEERPHEALANATPWSRYRPSSRAYPHRLRAVQYPDHFKTRKVALLGTRAAAASTGSAGGTTSACRTGFTRSPSAGRPRGAPAFTARAPGWSRW